MQVKDISYKVFHLQIPRLALAGENRNPTDRRGFDTFRNLSQEGKMGRSRIDNTYKITGDFIRVLVTRQDGSRYIVLIDSDDEFLLKLGRFQINKRKPDGRLTVMFWPWGSKKNIVLRTSSVLTREILKITDNMLVDHINHNTLGNRKHNLRLATTSENAQNRKGATTKSKTGIRGVYWNKNRRMWQAQAQVVGLPKHIGYFDNIADAEQAVTKRRAAHMPFSMEART